MDERDKAFEIPGATELYIDIDVEKGTRFVVYCYECRKVLYTFPKKNLITTTVSQSHGYAHSVAFSPPHNVMTIDLYTKTATQL